MTYYLENKQVHLELKDSHMVAFVDPARSV